MGNADTAPQSWQAEKSATTRATILEAAITCFLELGYAKTTTTKISDKAGLSRGAMLHHFPSKISLVKAAIAHLHEKRLKGYEAAISSVAADDPLRTDKCLQHTYELLTSDDSIAFYELMVASRTNPELARLMGPAMQNFYDRWYAMALDLWPELRDDLDRFELAMDLTIKLIEGMALRHFNVGDEARNKRLLAYLRDRLQEIFATDGDAAITRHAQRISA